MLSFKVSQMKNIVKHIIHTAIFFLILISFLLIISRLLMPKNNHKNAGMRDQSANGILAEKPGSIDVLILGDSESYSSLIPMQIWDEYGITAYCCGTPGQTLCYSLNFLEKAFKEQSPKIVILETNAIFHYFPLLDMATQKLDHIFPVFTYHNRWKTLTARDLDFAVNYTYIDNTKGYQFSRNIAAAKTDNYMTPTDKAQSIFGKNQFYLNCIKTYCEEHGAKLILVSTPSTKNWNMARHNSVVNLSEDLNVEYLDMNLMTEEVPIDWEKDTRDKGDHLNHSGAQKATAFLGKYLFESGLVRNHKGEPSYQSWDEALKVFKELTS